MTKPKTLAAAFIPPPRNATRAFQRCASSMLDFQPSAPRRCSGRALHSPSSENARAELLPALFWLEPERDATRPFDRHPLTLKAAVALTFRSARWECRPKGRRYKAAASCAGSFTRFRATAYAIGVRKPTRVRIFPSKLRANIY